MSLDPSWPADAASPAADELLTALLRSVSHDLASPLLTLSLSVELLAENHATTADERTRVGREAMQHGLQEFQRLLDAVTAISRARGRTLTPQLLSVRDLLGGQVVISDDDLSDVLVSLDPRCVQELLAALGGDRPAQVNLDIDAIEARFSVALPPSIEAFFGSPLYALLSSLQAHAGTTMVALAAAQVQLERQGGAVRCADGRAHFALPLVRDGQVGSSLGSGGAQS